MYQYDTSSAKNRLYVVEGAENYFPSCIGLWIDGQEVPAASGNQMKIENPAGWPLILNYYSIFVEFPTEFYRDCRREHAVYGSGGPRGGYEPCDR